MLPVWGADSGPSQEPDTNERSRPAGLWRNRGKGPLQDWVIFLPLSLGEWSSTATSLCKQGELSGRLWGARTRGKPPSLPKDTTGMSAPCWPLRGSLGSVYFWIKVVTRFTGVLLSKVFLLRWRKVFRNALHADRLRRQHGPAPERAGVGEPSLHTVALSTRCWSPRAAHSRFSSYAHFTAWKWIVMTFLKNKEPKPMWLHQCLHLSQML